MKPLIGNSFSQRRILLACILTCIASTCFVAPALALPGEGLPITSETKSVDTSAEPATKNLGADASVLALASTSEYTYSGAGCIAKTGGDEKRFVHKLVLPDGVVARYLRLYYYDNSSSDVVAFFTTYDGKGNFNEHVSVSSATGASDYGSVLSPEINYTVDSFAEPIVLLVNLGNQNDEALRFCGVRIAYERTPVSNFEYVNIAGSTFHPLAQQDPKIFSDGFE